MAMGTRGVGSPKQVPSATNHAADEDLEEISLVDIARVLYKRRIVLALSVVLALVTGGAITAFTTPEYEAEAQIIPLEHAQIIETWLESRQAAESAATSVGAPLYATLFPDEWDAQSSTWRGAAPRPDQVSRAVLQHVEVRDNGATRPADLVLTLTVTLPDAVLAADLARAYLQTLDTLRPELENITRSQLFNEFYDGTNAQEAQQRAETAAREKSYWIVFDSPAVPEDPVRPRPVLNMALAGVLGVMAGVFLVFGLEWLSKYRAEFTRVAPPPK